MYDAGDACVPPRSIGNASKGVHALGDCKGKPIVNPQIRYQIFVSSTYEDLREERQQATQAILEAGFFPSGMELFPASDDSQWELIKRVIEESDYYIVILGGRYGSSGPDGKSYTEMEYDYAVEKGIPVLGFVRSNPDEIPAGKTEKSVEGRRRLDAFRTKVKKRTCRLYSSPTELGMAVMKSLISETRTRPRVGWIRADQAKSADDVQRERELSEALIDAQRKIQNLQREIRDRSILANEVPRSDLAQGDDKYSMTVYFTDKDKSYVAETVELTWNEILKIIGPSMYGIILRKGSKYNGRPEYPFQIEIEEYIRKKIIDRVQNRKLKIEQHEVDTAIIQLKELGLLMYDEIEDDDGRTFRGITLTEHGEKELTLLNVARRKRK